MNVEEHLLVEIDRANTLEQVCLAEACDADLPVEKRERAERNHKLAGATSHELRTMLARHVLLS